MLLEAGFSVVLIRQVGTGKGKSSKGTLPRVLLKIVSPADPLVPDLELGIARAGKQPPLLLSPPCPSPTDRPGSLRRAGARGAAAGAEG